MLAKGENTSAIYRLKVTEKYAFVQTNSRLVKAEPSNTAEDDSSDMSEPGKAALNEPVIYSSHSIIK